MARPSYFEEDEDSDDESSEEGEWGYWGTEDEYVGEGEVEWPKSEAGPPQPPALNRLAKLLGKVEHPGVFAAGFEDKSAVKPGLHVKGLGRVALPLQQQQAERLHKLCVPAPFGRGEKTLWDPEVRSTGQLDPTQLKFTNSEWGGYVAGITQRLAANLGVPATDGVEAQLYKLLLYKPGDHFTPHRDTEKAPRMFATLAIMLPSQYTARAQPLS